MANTAVNGTESTDCDRKTHDGPNPPLNLASEPLPKLSFFGHADSSKATIADRSAIDKEKLPGQTAITKTTNCVAYAFDNHDGNCNETVQLPDIADGDDQQQLPDASSATGLEPRPEAQLPNLQCMLKTRSSRKHSSQRGKKCKARLRHASARTH
uniref:Uncharacterized protein n=1 Tax=Macrostomum lignano TaxID=282301 RepID=A0A1I8H7X9_9PLAT